MLPKERLPLTLSHFPIVAAGLEVTLEPGKLASHPGGWELWGKCAYDVPVSQAYSAESLAAFPKSGVKKLFPTDSKGVGLSLVCTSWNRITWFADFCWKSSLSPLWNPIPCCSLRIFRYCPQTSFRKNCLMSALQLCYRILKWHNVEFGLNCKWANAPMFVLTWKNRFKRSRKSSHMITQERSL